jgi:hypothetical protein
MFAGLTGLLRIIVKSSPAEPFSNMRLSCEKRFFILAFAAIACTDPSAPGTISARFELTDVDGQGLPAMAPPDEGIPGPTIIAGTMSLDQEGGAIISEDRLDSGGAQFTATSSYLYTIKGSTIAFDYSRPCPLDTTCGPLPAGQILDNGLRVRIFFGVGSPFQVYTFRTLP